MKRNGISNSNQFILIFLAIVTIIFILLGLRFFQLSVIKSSHNEDLASYNEGTSNTRSSIMEAKRGTIYDISGQPIAIDTTSYSMYAVLEDEDEELEVKDIDATARILSDYIALSRDEILDILTNQEAVQVEFGNAGRNLSQSTKDTIEVYNLAGIFFVSQSMRNYTNDYFASHLIGYAINDTEANEQLPTADILTGQIGIEAAYNRHLSGQTVLEANPELVERTNTLIGKDIYLTIDARLQNYLDELLAYSSNRYQPEEISAYLVEVETGKLLAAGQRPSFNLNTREGIEQQWTNQLVEEAFEPGSTMKILVQGVAHDLGLYSPNELIQTGSTEIEDVTVRDYNLYGWGAITFDEALARSSNVSVIELVRRMGVSNWVDKLAEFGFGKTTQSGLANETAGTIEFDNPVSATMSSFGQGIAASPIQLLQAFSTIGNDGKMMKIQYINGMEENNQFHPIELGQPISTDSANHVLDVMVDTVNEPYGSAKDFANANVQIAAKTGTAQIADPNGNGYLTGDNDYYFSVISFFPAENPKYMLYFTLKQPSITYNMMGSQILGEIFEPFVDYIMVYD